MNMPLHQVWGSLPVTISCLQLSLKGNAVDVCLFIPLANHYCTSNSGSAMSRCFVPLLELNLPFGYEHIQLFSVCFANVTCTYIRTYVSDI